MKYMRNYGSDLLEGKNSLSRQNPKFESLKQKYQSLIEDINVKLSNKKKEKLIFFGEKPEVKVNLLKIKEKPNSLRETPREKKEDMGANKKKKKKNRENLRRRKKTQDDMSIPCNNSNSVHINFLDDFKKMFVESEKNIGSSSDESRQSIKSENKSNLN